MKKVIVLLAVLLLTGICTNNSVMAQGKIAVVDVPAVVAKSVQVQSLKKEQQAKLQDLEKWLKVAQADVEKQKTKESKEQLLKKYNAEFAKKKDAIANNYKTKSQAIDKNITDTIVSTAKAKGYDMVISKGVVLYGGDDITAEVQKVVK